MVKDKIRGGLRDKINILVRNEKEQPIVNTVAEKEEDLLLGHIRVSDILTIQRDKSERIAEWLRTHPDYKWNEICVKINVQLGYIRRIIHLPNPLFRIEEIPQIEKIISEYGYK